MDVARELRERRETAEEMFRRDDLRSQLRDKLMRTARMSGDNVAEAEIDAAIGQYFDTLHTYQDPEPGFKRLPGTLLGVARKDRGGGGDRGSGRRQFLVYVCLVSCFCQRFNHRCRFLVPLCISN